MPCEVASKYLLHGTGRMLTLVYVVAIVVVYGILADGMERAVQRTFHARRTGPPVRLVEEFDVRPSHQVRVLHDRDASRRRRPGKPGRPIDGGSAAPAALLER